MEHLSILHTVEFYAPHVGGSETVVQRVSEGLVRRGHRVTVATTALPGRSFRQVGGVEVEGFAVEGRAADRITGESSRYRRFLLEHDCDVMMNYAAQQWATDLALQVVGPTWERRVNVLAPCGYSALHDDLSLRWPRFRDYFRRSLPVALPLYDAVVYHSPSLRDAAFGSRLGLRNGVIIRNGTDESEFGTVPGATFRRKYGITTTHMGLCVANYLPDKGHDRIIEAVRRMDRGDFTMVCIGAPSDLLPRLEGEAAGLPIRFLSGLPRPDTVAAFFEADLFLFASRIEASPLVLIEAMAAGLPFVSTDVGNVREYAGGRVVAPDALAAEASALLDNPGLRRALGAAGRKEWEESLTWTRIVDRWDALYLRLHREKMERRRPRLRAPSAGPTAIVAPEEAPARILGLIFSKDRPLQLDATLRSFSLHATGTAGFRMAVLYKASSSRMEALYRQVRREHPGTWFVREHDFRQDLLALLQGHAQVLFLVDDCVFVRATPLDEISALLDADPQAIGFSLRLGENTTYCYTMDREQRPPTFSRPRGDVLRFEWPGAELDFGYPLEVSSSLYRTRDILPLLSTLEFRNPNTLESQMAIAASRFRTSRPVLLSPARSLAFCLPVNRVQDIYDNRAGMKNAQPAEELASRYRAGARLDVGALSGHVPRSCHEELALPISWTAESCPVVSVVVPCYGQAHFLEEAVESVVAQTFQDWELIVVDDGSPDDTRDVARRLAAAHPDRSIRLLEKTNGGLADARNAGIRAARGAYILPLDADDVLDPRMLAACVDLLDREHGVAIAYTDLEHFGEVSRIVRAGEFHARNLRRENQLNYCSMYRRTAWEQTGGYDDLMSLGYEDWDFWVRCAGQGLIARRIPEPLLRYRVKADSMYGTALAHDAQLRAQVVLDNSRSYGRSYHRRARALLLERPLPPPQASPQVSVVVATRYRPHLLREALASIGAQTMKDLEILLVSDGGMDVEDVVRLAGVAAITRVIRHGRRLGLAAARNAALAFARGRYVAYLDDDDHFLPEHLETLLAVLRASGLKVAYADSRRFEEAPDGNGGYARVNESVVYSVDWNPAQLLRGNFIPVPCIVHERSCLLETGPFDERLPNHEDWDLWIRLSRRFLFAHLPIVTSEYRWRTDGTTMSSGPNRKYGRNLLRVGLRSLPWLTFPPDTSGVVRTPLGHPIRDLLQNGVPRIARGAFECLRNRLGRSRP